MTGGPAVLIATYLEPEHVERIGDSVDCQLLYAPELLPRPRYRNDHGGVPPALTAADERRWTGMLARAEVSFDFDWRAPGDLPGSAPNLRWVQGTSAGIGGFVRRHGLDAGDLVLTTAAGIHAGPLAEFAVAGALFFVKDIPGLRERQRARHWQRHVSGQLAGRRATVVGLGAVGRRVVQAYGLLGVRVTGVGRPGHAYRVDHADRVVSTDDLDAVLPDTDILVLACPLTPATRGLIGAARVAALPEDAIVVNVARGEVVDEDALSAALGSGRLLGAALDVFRHEPLPAGSPLWNLPNVLVSPHSASTAAQENAVLTDLFIDNLRRFLDGRPMRNLYRRDRGY
ncbi:D-2-hydroxyacid dehydrogenase [Rugosimonospora africana]|uniref:Hydroxyacid dehydrogenase n=1 Tax=Rugosimonospora africana TaxID=556532 RepID=A0A8J3R2D6_9ACTN|nr:D-2-hydroxyacid dehydrogenase [Rugosimonospora africana]GIH20105.1 hydroxyacid dehydrogenase [Rugosimonospora africana]